MAKKKYSFEINKITFLILVSFIFFIIIIFKLFSLQILNYDKYQEIASKEQIGVIELSAQRGEILIKDYHSDEEFLLATNTTLNLIYADPSLIKDEIFLAEKLTSLLFDVDVEREKDNERIKDLRPSLITKIANEEISEEEATKLLTPLTDLELQNNYKKTIIDTLSEKQRKEIILGFDIDEQTLQEVQKLNIPGIEIIDNDLYAYPPQITDEQEVADLLQGPLKTPSLKLETILKGKNRYVILKRKLEPEISDQIIALIKEFPEEFRGISLQEEYFRFYPEGTLAANIIGYVDRSNNGQYGIENTFNEELKGKPGTFKTKKDSVGRQITVGDTELEKALDGNTILLSIDRSIQAKVDQILEQSVKKYNADSGQVLIMNPQTGAIIAMSNYPSFDPNLYGDVFKKIEIILSLEEIDSLYPTKDEGIYMMYTNPITLDYFFIFKEEDRYFRYENYVGPEVYHNKIISWPYEPGSVFKTIAMSIGIDDGDVTANTTYNNVGPIEVDFNQYTEKYDFKIKDSHEYFGLVNMKTVLAESLNTGMTFVAKEMGSALFYNYLKKFGFLDKTEIELNSENIGYIENYKDWSESELATHAFGQGISVNMLQVANAYSAIINGGILVQPYIIDEIRYPDGTVTKTEKKEIRRVISEETSKIMKDMLVYSVEEGVASPAALETHYIGGKTGTSQTYKNGRALSGAGTTIGSFAGFGPIDNPQFLILVKLDKTKTSEWGDSTAAPTAKIIAEFLFEYYNIAPDKI